MWDGVCGRWSCAWGPAAGEGAVSAARCARVQQSRGAAAKKTQRCCTEQMQVTHSAHAQLMCVPLLHKRTTQVSAAQGRCRQPTAPMRSSCVSLCCTSGPRKSLLHCLPAAYDPQHAQPLRWLFERAICRPQPDRAKALSMCAHSDQQPRQHPMHCESAEHSHQATQLPEHICSLEHAHTAP